MNTVATYSLIQTFQFDPTRTLTLRNAFVRDMDRRFADLIKVIRQAIVDQDCFGLNVQTYAALTPPLPGQFNFPRTAEKVDAFMLWLRGQVDKGLLETTQFQRIGSSVESAWTNMYVQDSYKRGIQRARAELRKAGYSVPPDAALGNVAGTIVSPFNAPFHMDRVGLMYTRTFSKLQGITAAMDTQISEILAQGLIDGDGAALLARKLTATITGQGAADLGITDSLGRHIPARRRAQTLARTEIVRAHHAANIQEYKNWGVEGVEVIAEFVTAGDDRVCDQCAGYHGNRYTLSEAEYMIPVHPNCRCIVIPVDKRDVTGKIIGEEVSERTVPAWQNKSSWKAVEDVSTGVKVNPINMSMNADVQNASTLKRANVIGQTITDDVFGTLDDFAKQTIDKSGKIPHLYTHIATSYNPINASSRSVFAYYRPEYRAIDVGTKAVIRTAPNLRIGGGAWNVGTDLSTIVRHEYGHHIWHQYLDFGITGAQRKQWMTLFKENKSLFKRKVSGYAATDHDEAFAECFAAYTSPKYGIDGTRLPSAIEKVLESILGKRKL